MEFSHHLGDLEITDMIDRFWDLASFFCADSVDSSGTRHLVVRIMATLAREPCYVCIQEDSLESHAMYVFMRIHLQRVRP